jgi:hypothetical protein
VQYELTQGKKGAIGNLLRSINDPGYAGSVVSEGYESPRDILGEAAKRGQYAASLAGIPGASAFAATAPQSAPGASNIDRSIEVLIQKMDINTQATDAQGIADDFTQGLDSQANYGQN